MVLYTINGGCKGIIYAVMLHKCNLLGTNVLSLCSGCTNGSSLANYKWISLINQKWNTAVYTPPNPSFNVSIVYSNTSDTIPSKVHKLHYLPYMKHNFTD